MKWVKPQDWLDCTLWSISAKKRKTLKSLERFTWSKRQAEVSQPSPNAPKQAGKRPKRQAGLNNRAGRKQAKRLECWLARNAQYTIWQGQKGSYIYREAD